MQYIKNNSGTAAKSICAEILIETKTKLFFYFPSTKSASIQNKVLFLHFRKTGHTKDHRSLVFRSPAQWYHFKLNSFTTQTQVIFEIKMLSNTTGSVLGLL